MISARGGVVKDTRGCVVGFIFCIGTNSQIANTWDAPANNEDNGLNDAKSYARVYDRTFGLADGLKSKSWSVQQPFDIITPKSGQLALETPQTAQSTNLGLNPVTVAAPNTVSRPPVNPVTVTPPTATPPKVTPPNNGSSTPPAPQATPAAQTTPQAATTTTTNPSTTLSSPTIPSKQTNLTTPPIGTTTPAPSSNPSPAVSSPAQPIPLPAPVNTLPNAVSSAVNPTSVQSPLSSSVPVINPIAVTAPNQVTPPIVGSSSAVSVIAPVSSVPVNPITVKPPIGVSTKPMNIVGGQLQIGAFSFWVDDLYFVDDETEAELKNSGLRGAFEDLIRRQNEAMAQLTETQKTQLASIFGRFNARTAKRELDRLGPGTFGGRPAFVSVQIINNATAGDKNLSPEERLRYNLALNILILNGDPQGVVNYLDHAAGLVKDNNAKTGPVQDLWDRLIRYSYTGEWRLPKLDNFTAAARYLDRKNLSGWVAPAMMEAGAWVGTRIGDAFKGRISRTSRSVNCKNSFSADTKVWVTRAANNLTEKAKSVLKKTKTIAKTVITAVAISSIAIGTQVLANNEQTKLESSQEVTATHEHTDPIIVTLKLETSDKKLETITTTPEHPFFALLEPNKNSNGIWVNAGELENGNWLRRANGETGIVKSVSFEVKSQKMYNLTVEKDHTFFVGDGQWLVHNTPSGGRPCIVGDPNNPDVVDARVAQNRNTRDGSPLNYLQGQKVQVGTGSSRVTMDVDLQPTLTNIQAGNKIYPQDGQPYANISSPSLPPRPPGFYTEYVVPTPNVSGAGSQRIVVGADGKIYYTPDHYGSWITLSPTPTYKPGGK